MQSPTSSVKTEVIDNNVTLTNVLQENILYNVNDHLTNIDVVDLYNSVLMETDIFNTQHDQQLYEFLQLHMVKCRISGYVQHVLDIKAFIDFIQGHLHNKFVALDAIVYCASIDYTPKIKKDDSINSTITRMYI